MSQSDEQVSSPEASAGVTAKPAVGAIVTEDSEADVALLVLRAVNHGFPVVLTYRGLRPARLNFFDRDGVTIVHPEEDFPTEAELVSLLLRTASELGAPGLIYHEDTSQAVNYLESAALLEGDRERIDESGTSRVPVEQTCEVLVAIPAYNESDTIGEVVSSAVNFADDVLVVDDGSSDDTAEIAAERGADVVVHPENKGYGAALKTAFREAHRRNAERLVTLDADGQHDPAHVPNLLETLETGDADVVIGSRFDGLDSDIPRYRRFGIGVINIMTNIGLGAVGRRSWISDTQSGFRAYDSSAVEMLARDGDLGDGMSASTDILYDIQRGGYQIDSVGIEVDYEVENANTQHPVTHGVSVTKSILRRTEREHLLGLIGFPGVVMAGGGLGLSYWVLSDFATTGTLTIGGTLLAALLVLVGLFACFVSIVIHELNALLRQFTD